MPKKPTIPNMQNSRQISSSSMGKSAAEFHLFIVQLFKRNGYIEQKRPRPDGPGRRF